MATTFPSNLARFSEPAMGETFAHANIGELDCETYTCNVKESPILTALQGWAKEWSLGLEIFCLV